MNVDRPDPARTLARAALRIDELRAFRGPPNEFWPAYLDTLAVLAGGADAAALLIPVEAPAHPVAEDTPPASRWRTGWEWAVPALAEGRAQVFRNCLRLAADVAKRAGLALDALTGNERALAGPGWLAAVRLETAGEGPAVVVLLLPAVERAAAEEGLCRVRLAADVPHASGVQGQLAAARVDVETLASALDLVTLLDAETQFSAAAMTLVNELAARHQCQRVSLGWRRGPYLRVRAISHLEKFEKRMVVVQQLEAAMEEAADQDTEIVLPLPIPAESGLLVRDHETYAADQKPGFLASVPLRVQGTPAGVLTCERNERAFTPQELRHLRLAADHAARRLNVLELAEAWFGKRVARAARAKLTGLLGVEHTLAKAAAVAGALFLAWAVVWRIDYRVEAAFALRGADTAVLSAPFDGFLGESQVEKGDAITAGTVVATLDQTELALELSAAEADATRFEAEVQQARSERKLAEMQIAQARADQAKARRDILKLRLAQSTVTAPFDGVIVEGDLRERAGAPLKQGDALFRLARLDRMYAEVMVPEADIRGIRVGATGELAFASQPDRKFAVSIERIEPMAMPRPEGNVFLVRCILPVEAQAWWRPGMSGVAKLDAGSRTPLWIATHRTVDYLRLRWW